MERNIVITADGSQSIQVPSLNIMYHSKHGALQESMHVFIQHGIQALMPFQKPYVVAVEMGFGTGLNCQLLHAFAKQNKIRIHYTGIEAYPLAPAEWQQLAYDALLPQGTVTSQQLHALPADTWCEIDEYFAVYKIHQALEDAMLPTEIDLVLYDAFAPAAQPTLWEQPIFDRWYSHMANGGLLTTYCSKGDVRRALLAAGFIAKKLPGPPGKREMLQAFKPYI